VTELNITRPNVGFEGMGHSTAAVKQSVLAHPYVSRLLYIAYGTLRKRFKKIIHYVIALINLKSQAKLFTYHLGINIIAMA